MGTRGFSLHFGTATAALALLTLARPAVAQQAQPLPPLPSQAPQYAPPSQQGQPQPYYSQQPPPPPPYYAQQPGYGQPYQPAPYYAEPPPPPEEPTHAPKFSLWTGARLGALGFGGGFYGIDVGDPNGTHAETTGNLVTSGPTLELDVGARLGRRYIPFIGWEHSFLHAGHRFDGNPNASAYAEWYGLGLRYTSGDVDSAGFLTELSIGKRTVSVSDGSSTYQLQALEFLKLGLGAEIRLSTLFVLSPLASIATGQMSDTSGTVRFSNTLPVSGNVPPFAGNGGVNDTRTYVVVSLAMGAHFDVFGK